MELDSKIEILPSYTLDDGTELFGTYNLKNGAYILGAATRRDKNYPHKLVNGLLKAYLARALGFKVYEEDAHWAHFMNVKAFTIGKSSTHDIWYSHNNESKIHGATHRFAICKNIKKVEELV